jgi:hypothetical protein
MNRKPLERIGDDLFTSSRCVSLFFNSAVQLEEFTTHEVTFLVISLDLRYGAF